MATPQLSSLSVLVPDYEEFFLQETHANVTIVILDEFASSVEAAVYCRLPGHSMVLVAFSQYCKAKVGELHTDQASIEAYFAVKRIYST
jgi:hypothetical protein